MEVECEEEKETFDFEMRVDEEECSIQEMEIDGQTSIESS